VLPRLNYCSTASNDVAALVRANLDVNQTAGSQMSAGYATLKQKVESLYPCMGITCVDVGEFQNSAGVYSGMEACLDPTPPPTPAATTEAPSSSTDESAAAMLGLAAALLLVNA
jgi:hypothetical protein